MCVLLVTGLYLIDDTGKCATKKIALSNIKYFQEVAGKATRKMVAFGFAEMTSTKPLCA